MYTQNRETLLKTSLVSWVPLINYYSVLSLIIFKPKIFFEGLSFEIEIWRDNWVFITSTFESWKEKGKQNFDHSSTLTGGWKTIKS